MISPLKQEVLGLTRPIPFSFRVEFKKIREKKKSMIENNWNNTLALLKTKDSDIEDIYH